MYDYSAFVHLHFDDVTQDPKQQPRKLNLFLTGAMFEILSWDPSRGV